MGRPLYVQLFDHLSNHNGHDLVNCTVADDNDFEIFVSPDGTNWFYKEIEINAANATWDLCLNKPYDDNGYENSTRVFGAGGFEMQPPMHSAVHVDGILNDPTSPHQYWSLEVALPLSRLVYNTTSTLPLTNGTFWRVNFSRVEWAVKVVNGTYQKYPSCQSCPVPGSPVEDNWVWSPQGEIAMHEPERWGMLQFSRGAVNTTAPVINPQWPIRSAAMALYYAQHAYADANGGLFTTQVSELLPFTSTPWALDGTCTTIPAIDVGANGTSFHAALATIDSAYAATITNDRYLLVEG